MGFDAKGFGRVIVCYSVVMLILVSLGLWKAVELFSDMIELLIK